MSELWFLLKTLRFPIAIVSVLYPADYIRPTSLLYPVVDPLLVDFPHLMQQLVAAVPVLAVPRPLLPFILLGFPQLPVSAVNLLFLHCFTRIPQTYLLAIFALVCNFWICHPFPNRSICSLFSYLRILLNYTGIPLLTSNASKSFPRFVFTL